MTARAAVHFDRPDSSMNRATVQSVQRGDGHSDPMPERANCASVQTVSTIGAEPDPFNVDIDPTCGGSIVLALDRDGVRIRRTGPRWWDAVAYGPRLPACDVCAPELEVYIGNLVAGLGDCERPEGFVVRGAIRVLVDRAVARAVRGEREKARAARLEADRQAELERLAVGRR